MNRFLRSFLTFSEISPKTFELEFFKSTLQSTFVTSAPVTFKVLLVIVVVNVDLVGSAVLAVDA